MLAVVWRLLCSILLAVSAMDVAYSWASVASALMATAGCCDGVLATATPERAEASWSQFVAVASSDHLSIISLQNKSINAELLALLGRAPCWAPSEVPRSSDELLQAIRPSAT